MTETKQLGLKQVYFSARMKSVINGVVIICVDESGSMLDLVIHTRSWQAFLPDCRCWTRSFVIFDNQSVVDLLTSVE